MSDFTVRSDNVDVEQIMRQIRARIREKRGVDYTEEEIRELANVKLEKFIDPKGVRSNLLEEYRRLNTAEEPLPNFAFEEDTMFETHRAPIRWLRALLRPFLKLLFNPNPLIKALHIQSELNARNAEHHARVDALHYEVIHNLVVELTRTGIEVKSLKMRLESMASRLDFDERRARALEGVVQYRAGAVPPLQPPSGQDQGRRDQGRRDQGPRNQGPREQGPRNQGPREQGPREQGSREQGSRDQGAREQGPREQGPREQAPRDQSPAAEAPATEGFQGNALDAEGNERRARRRRRRGRRRPGDRPAFAGDTTSAVFGEASPREEGEATGGRSVEMGQPESDQVADRRTPDLGPAGDSAPVAAATPPDSPSES